MQSSMASWSRAMALAMLLVSTLFFSSHASFAIPIQAASDDFLRCMSASVPGQLLFPRSSPSFGSVLASSVRNPRFLAPAMVRPLCIVTATNASHVQAAVVCGRRHGIRLRVRSGGHDYEGLSFISQRNEDFAVVDLAALRSVRVTVREPAEAWVESGATLGELYHAIGRATDRHAFPGGLCPTVGVGGHLSGGGFGMLLRKYGLASDHVINAVMVDAEGRLLDKEAMGRDVFWAIRGGGGGSFGIVLSWKLRLVAVPPRVTVVTITKSVQQGAADLVAKWQEVAPSLSDDLLLRVVVQGTEAKFQALYLGTRDALLPVIGSRFPELGVNPSHCKEMSWIQSVPFIYIGERATVDDILNRAVARDASPYKATSDYVRRAIPRDAWAQIFSNWLARPGAGLMILDPYGGSIANTPESATPYPHRAGVLYNIQYMTFWGVGGDGAANTRWMRDMLGFMGQHVSSNPREAYVNYRDLDLGQNVIGAGDVTSFEAGRVWGEKYFKSNFRRLAMAKGQIDPRDYFRSEQSIPPLVGEQLEMASTSRNVTHVDGVNRGWWAVECGAGSLCSVLSSVLAKLMPSFS